VEAGLLNETELQYSGGPAAPASFTSPDSPACADVTRKSGASGQPLVMAGVQLERRMAGPRDCVLEKRKPYADSAYDME